MEKYRNAFILHFIMNLPRRVLLETALKAGIDTYRELTTKSRKELISELFEMVKHPHEGNEFLTALETSKTLLRTRGGLELGVEKGRLRLKGKGWGVEVE